MSADRGQIESIERMVLRHAPASVAAASVAAAAPTHNHQHGGHVPLNDLKQMLAAVTEYVTPALTLFLLLVTTVVLRAWQHSTAHIVREIPTPPPRIALA